VVVSSLAIHNVAGVAERAKALREAARVLKNGGKLAIADIRHTRAYANALEACGLKIADRSDFASGTAAGNGWRAAWLLRSSRSRCPRSQTRYLIWFSATERFEGRRRAIISSVMLSTLLDGPEAMELRSGMKRQKWTEDQTRSRTPVTGFA
jgi:SAM-dependent methyltransferase